MISVVIRNKNQATALSFLLKNLTERYAADIAEIIVIDNSSIDDSEAVTMQYGARFVTIEKFSYGGSANRVAQEAQFPIVVIFSAHSYPVSHDFFKLIREKMEANSNLAGLRCLHSTNDYRNYINKVTAKTDPNKSGLIFSGSAFSKKIWEKHPFREDVATFEDKEWSKRVLENGYEIEFVPAIFHYEIKRTPQQHFFRFRNDVVGNYQLWHQDISLLQAVKGLVVSIWNCSKNFIIEFRYAVLRFLYLIKFMGNKPRQF
ncbi:glycosyltransferase family 2 protein [Flavobacterium commune]|uniref:Glycosyl transferase family 2 n=1 Tax=Flavobacterium commune TaxID=1306519 RepID=A0A1D9P7G1_9FLAO|nr:glycosyltransferase [Flavobacterium commune]AOZ98510.1 glycosyl transferase family 2 [Flavobacterium commune]